MANEKNFVTKITPRNQDFANDYTTVSDTRFCENPCVNGLLDYYAGFAEAQGVSLSVRAVCDRLPFSDVDLTILLGNALDNAVRAALEGAKHEHGIQSAGAGNADDLDVGRVVHTTRARKVSARIATPVAAEGNDIRFPFLVHRHIASTSAMI